jgi:hypothetical protein
MQLTLNRIISTAKGTNGYLEEQIKPNLGKEICKTIELPWLDNQTGKSCVPAGTYELKQRHSLQFGDHLILENVPSRSLILMHPANDALKELRGCIAPVTSFNGVGNGNSSRAALAKVLALVNPVFANGDAVFLTIKDAHK